MVGEKGPSFGGALRILTRLWAHSSAEIDRAVDTEVGSKPEVFKESYRTVPNTFAGNKSDFFKRDPPQKKASLGFRICSVV